MYTDIQIADMNFSILLYADDAVLIMYFYICGIVLLILLWVVLVGECCIYSSKYGLGTFWCMTLK